MEELDVRSACTSRSHPAGVLSGVEGGPSRAERNEPVRKIGKIQARVMSFMERFFDGLPGEVYIVVVLEEVFLIFSASTPARAWTCS